MFNSLPVVLGLKPPGLFVNAMPDERGSDPSSDHSMLSRKTNNCDHSVIRVAQAMFWNAIAHGARLVFICSGGQHDDSRVSVSCRVFISVNVDEPERVGCPDGKGSA